MIFHITSGEDWARALEAGEYRLSTRGRSLAQVGFVHCAERDQVERVAQAFYEGATGLVLLAIAEELVHAEIRRECADGGRDPFPHIYGPLEVTAVVAAIPFEPGRDGRFTLPGGLP